MARILIIDDDELIRSGLSRCFGDLGHEVLTAHGLGQGIERARSGVDVIYLDLSLPDGGRPHGHQRAFRRARRAGDHRPDGAARQLRRPGDPDQRGVGLHPETGHPVHPQIVTGERAEVPRGQGRHAGADPGVRRRVHHRRLPGHQPGQAAHGQGPPRARPRCLCSGRPAWARSWQLRPSTATAPGARAPSWSWTAPTSRRACSKACFTGTSRGRSTGAHGDHRGLVAEADTGTLFLDEVGELPPALQKSFLRVLQEHRFRPVGVRPRTDQRLPAWWRPPTGTWRP